jgi:LEA14-like dessication related protein
MRRSAALLLVASAAATAACATLGRASFKEPVVTLNNAQITGLGLSGGTVNVALAVYNPNDFRLDGVRLTYNVLVDTVKFGAGSYDSRFTVNKADTTRLEFPLSFTYAGVGAAGRQLIQMGSVDYRVVGDITVATPLGQFTRPYEGHGRFNPLSGRP